MENIRFHSVMPHVFRGRTDLDSEIWNNDVRFEKGKTYLVEAASGNGKSTFCSYVIGHRHDYDGEITFDDADIADFGKADWVAQRQRHVSHLFQELRLFPELTAMENVEIKNRLTGFKTTAQITRWFERLGIADMMGRKTANMSYGQQQRVAFMRALVQPYDFIIMDEPVSHLDDDNAAIMGEIVREEAAQQGAGIIITSIGRHIDMVYNKTFRL